MTDNIYGSDRPFGENTAPEASQNTQNAFTDTNEASTAPTEAPKFTKTPAEPAYRPAPAPEAAPAEPAYRPAPAPEAAPAEPAYRPASPAPEAAPAEPAYRPASPAQDFYRQSPEQHYYEKQSEVNQYAERTSPAAQPWRPDYDGAPRRNPPKDDAGQRNDGYGRTSEWSYGRPAGAPRYGQDGAGYRGSSDYFPRDNAESHPGYHGYDAPRSKPKKEKKKGEWKNRLAPIALTLAVISIICSLGSPFLYHLIFAKGGSSSSGSGASRASADTTVLYRSVETTVDKSGMPVIDIANTVSDSVVEITTEYVTTGYFGYGQYVTEGAGSGVIISEDGKIITNNHVITGSSNNKTADKITVRLRNGEEYPATLIGRDADYDIAVIQIEADNLTPAVWGNSDDLEVGEQIVVVGNPLGELGGTVTTGIVSASDREIKIDDVTMTLIQTDAAVNPGNSGGGMFNASGELIGIVNAKSSGTGIEGLGFAIPGNEAMNVAEQIIEYGYVKGKAYLGISFYEASTGGWFSSDGSTILYVYYLEEGYNDDVLKQGDQVLSVDGTDVSSKADVKAILREHEVGDTLTFQILRNNKTMEVEVKCYEYTPSDDDIVFES